MRLGLEQCDLLGKVGRLWSLDFGIGKSLYAFKVGGDA